MRRLYFGEEVVGASDGMSVDDGVVSGEEEAVLMKYFGRLGLEQSKAKSCALGMELVGYIHSSS